jgi:sigma-E factor negative regulatory protein RseA
MKEQLSAFMDSEANGLEERRVLKTLETDLGLRATWERYQLIRAAIRRELSGALVPGLATRVARQIQDTPAAPAPSLLRRVSPENAIRTMGIGAIAAAVAVFAIVGLQTLNQPASAPSTQVATGKTSQSDYIRVGATGWSTNQPELESALNVYLVEHNEFAPTGMNSMLPYVRVVVYDSNQ